MSWTDDDDFDEFDELDEEDDDVEQEDEEDLLQRIEQAFRSERARIRGCDDLDELRALRTSYVNMEASGRLNQAGRIRARDLVELVDDRLTDLKAQRIAARRS